MAEEFPTVEFRVNGEEVRIAAHPATPLMYLLRNDLDLQGVRTGCSIGECGVCTVIIDGEAVQSCQLPLSEAAGIDVTTPEGLGGPDDPHPVQDAFLTEQAAQCGYCINGMIMTVAAKVAAAEPPSADDLRDALDEHICRCGTHDRVLRAAQRAAGTPVEPTHRTISEDPLPADPGTEQEGLPPGLADEPRIERWITLDETGIVIHPGKVELGQGITTALAQIVAGQLGLPLEAISVEPTATDRSPDQGQTSGSFSVEHGGTALAMAAVAFRRVLLSNAAELLGTSTESLTLSADGVGDGAGKQLSFPELTEAGTPTGTVRSSDLPRWDAPLLGQPLARPDLRMKLTGAPAYVHDLAFDGMLHARAVLPPTIEARAEHRDLEAIAAMPGVREVVQDGELVIVIAEREEQALRAHTRLTGDTRWSTPAGPPSRDGAEVLRALPSEPVVARHDEDLDELLGDDFHEAEYTRGYQSHGPMAPSAAVAVLEDGLLKVWTHSQGVYPLRRELAALLAMPEDDLVVEHAAGPGCYGLNLSDDAAAFAAIAARAVPGRPVRLQLSMPDEFGFDPTGPAMIATLRGSVDEAGAIKGWRHDVITDSHSTRANGDGDRLLAAWIRDDRVERPWVGLGEPGHRNSVPLYDIPAVGATAHYVRGPIRTGPLRSLGSFHNVFAAESFMDELAERAGKDPVEFRLAHLTEPRARRVLEVAAEQAGWSPHVGPSGRGQGLALCRYKDSKAWTVVVADVDVDQEAGSFRVDRLLVVTDAGAIINADGLRNQLEGGAIQGLSRTLFEELHLSAEGPVERDWTTYPIVRFRHVPRIEVTLLDRRDQPPVGAGESSTPAVPPAVANALDDCLGVRLRTLPLTASSLERRLLEMDEQEAARVLL